MQPSYSWSNPATATHRSIAHIKKQPIWNLLTWPSLTNQQLCYNRWNSRVLAGKESRVTLFIGELWHFFVSFIVFIGLLWLLLFEEVFIKVVKLSVNILEADSVSWIDSAVMLLAALLSIDRIRSIPGHKQISLTSYVILWDRIHKKARC